jgi:phytanoyl-CoA hydroxylase
MHFEEGYLKRPLPPQPEMAGPSAASQPDAIDQFVKEGFLVIRNFIKPQEVEACIARLQFILDNWQNGERPGQDDPVNEAPSTPLVDVDMHFKSGRLPMPADTIDAIRRFFRMAIHDDFFREFATSPDILGPLKTLWGKDIALLQSMGLLKPPGTGEKRWHADQGYFRLIHPDKSVQGNEVAAFWIALDPCDEKNGCMFVAPRSHVEGTPLHGIPPTGADGRPLSDVNGHIFYSAVEPPAIDNVFPVPMQPGDALLFHGNLLHFTPPNRTARRRRGLQFHYAAAGCRPVSCSSTAIKDKINAPARFYGPAPPALTAADIDGDGAGAGFDCVPNDGICIEPQYWAYRRAELIASGKQGGPGCI